MHDPASATDLTTPSTGADIALVLSLLLVLLGLSTGVFWSEQAAAQEGDWRGIVPFLVVTTAATLLLRLRRAYPTLPRLRRFLTRIAAVGLGGGVAFGVFLLLHA